MDVARGDVGKFCARPVRGRFAGKARDFGLQVLEKQPQIAGIGIARQGLRSRLDGAKKIRTDGGEFGKHLARQKRDLLGALLGIVQILGHGFSLQGDGRKKSLAGGNTAE